MKIYSGLKKSVTALNTKKELQSMLNEYKGVISSYMSDYLNSLIELEFSIMRNYISLQNRKVLSELEIYKRIAIYNIYYRAINIIDNNDDDKINIYSGDNTLRISANYKNENIELFNFDFSQHLPFNSKIPANYKNLEIGTISLSQTIENNELRKAELNRIMNTLERLYDEKISCGRSIHSGTIGGLNSSWAFEHAKKIKEYEKRFTELDEKKELTEDEIQKIAITKKYHDLMFEDYKLTEDDFKDENTIPFANLYEEKSELNKTLTKRMPNLSIIDNINYI